MAARADCANHGTSANDNTGGQPLDVCWAPTPTPAIYARKTDPGFRVEAVWREVVRSKCC
jgi:hypothetical protein